MVAQGVARRVQEEELPPSTCKGGVWMPVEPGVGDDVGLMGEVEE
jgi:hypothetical protein